MKELFLPFAINLDLEGGALKPYSQITKRHLSDMRGMYADDAATEEAIRKGDPLIYEVYERDVPEERGQLIVVTSIIHPGRVKDEYYMTKGHFHAKEDTAEVYLGVKGEGYLLLETREAQFKALPMRPGTVTYIPPYWAHRTVNTGKEDFIFFGVYPADAGHNYGDVERVGFAQILVERDGVPTLVPNVKRMKQGSGGGRG